MKKKKVQKKAKAKQFGTSRRQLLAALRAFLQWNTLTKAQRESFFEVDEMVDGQVEAVGNELLRCLTMNITHALPQMWTIVHHLEGADDAAVELQKMAHRRSTAKRATKKK